MKTVTIEAIRNMNKFKHQFHGEGSLRMERKPAREPAIIAAERVYKSSNQFALDKLLKKATLYRRRLTIAQCALDENQREIQKLLLEIAGERMSEPRKEVK